MVLRYVKISPSHIFEDILHHMTSPFGSKNSEHVEDGVGYIDKTVWVMIDFRTQVSGGHEVQEQRNRIVGT